MSKRKGSVDTAPPPPESPSVTDEADAVLHVLLVDYFLSHGCPETARTLHDEAKGMGSKLARAYPLGSLKDWWLIFWDLFNNVVRKTLKVDQNSPPDVSLFHQTLQSVQGHGSFAARSPAVKTSASEAPNIFSTLFAHPSTPSPLPARATLKSAPASEPKTAAVPSPPPAPPAAPVSSKKQAAGSKTPRKLPVAVSPAKRKAPARREISLSSPSTSPTPVRGKVNEDIEDDDGAWVPPSKRPRRQEQPVMEGEKLLRPRASRYRGVSKNGNQWQALIMVNKMKKYIGSFSSEEEAAVAYDKAALQYHGFKAKTNFRYPEHSDWREENMA